MSELKKVHVTNREFQFLFWLSNGLSAKEIARKMNISPRTIEDYMRNVRQKTNLYKRSQLVSFFKSQNEYEVKNRVVSNPDDF